VLVVVVVVVVVAAAVKVLEFVFHVAFLFKSKLYGNQQQLLCV